MDKMSVFVLHRAYSCHAPLKVYGGQLISPHSEFRTEMHQVVFLKNLFKIIYS